LCFCVAAKEPPADRYPGIAKAYLLRANDDVFAASNANTPLAPASLTKIMMALVVLQEYTPNATATVSSTAAAATGSRIGLRAGDKIRVEDLLRAALIASANDACRAIAEWRSGSESNFVATMNIMVTKLGLKQTHFANACGHDAPGHVSSAHDLAIMADHAMRDDRFAAIVRQIDASVSTADGKRVFPLTNRNALIGRYAGAIGVKSGYTPGAGKCLVAWAERGSVRALVVLLGARDRWWDAVALLDKTFEYGQQLGR
jgi:D-alanyl-D-alanine carboxypeptidase (penicillin-binding protein 5/6)